MLICDGSPYRSVMCFCLAHRRRWYAYYWRVSRHRQLPRRSAARWSLVPLSLAVEDLQRHSERSAGALLAKRRQRGGYLLYRLIELILMNVRYWAFTRSDPGYVRLSVRPVGQTGRTDCSRTAHICQSNQCGLLADYNTAYAAA